MCQKADVYICLKELPSGFNKILHHKEIQNLIQGYVMKTLENSLHISLPLFPLPSLSSTLAGIQRRKKRAAEHILTYLIL